MIKTERPTRGRSSKVQAAPKIVAYQIVTVSGTEAVIEEEVNKAIKQGWTPLGGVAIHASDIYTSIRYAQAMVKYAV